MANTPKNVAGGGVFIALGAMAGVAAGHWLGGQTTIGLIAGVATGSAIAIAMWFFSRR